MPGQPFRLLRRFSRTRTIRLVFGRRPPKPLGRSVRPPFLLSLNFSRTGMIGLVRKAVTPRIQARGPKGKTARPSRVTAARTWRWFGRLGGGRRRGLYPAVGINPTARQRLDTPLDHDAHRPLLSRRAETRPADRRRRARRPRSSTPARSGSPRKSSPPTSSAAMPRCRSTGTAWSARGGCSGSSRRPPAWTIAWCRRSSSRRSP